MNDTGGALTGLIVGLVVVVGVFLLIRAFWLWYWKVDEQVALLKDISASLRRLQGASGSAPLAEPAAAAPGVPKTREDGKMRCPSCERFVTPKDWKDGKHCPDDWTLLVPTE